MTEKDYASIRADADAVEAARDAKRDDETWGEYLLRCADAEVPRKWTPREIEEKIAEEITEFERRLERELHR